MTTRSTRPIPIRKLTGIPVRDGPRLGQLLVEAGHLSPTDLSRAVFMLAREEARLGDVLLTHGMVDERALYESLARQFSAKLVELGTEPPDPRLIDRFGIDACLALGVLPWRSIGGAVIVATSQPERFGDARPRLEAVFGRVLMVVATERDLVAAATGGRRAQLVRKAEVRVAERDSCRGWARGGAPVWMAAFGALAVGLVAVAPGPAMLVLAVWGVITLVLASALKAAATILQVRDVGRAGRAPEPSPSDPIIARLPVVSVMVPLYKEREIAERLVCRLAALTYPKELLDVLLVVEEDDTVTRETLAGVTLPAWLRCVTVPRGSVQTKPRALNYALDFCRGSIVGVYDAEDAPAPDQINQVVRHFHQRGPEVACLQGVLDFYNARTNWLARCFSVEYASWFRVILPGFVKLGLVIPLGGTTLFFRRDALEALGGWDAHNVTEDADLGIRLARRGYRTELVGTVTQEEANARLWPWVKQRSRWLKGYAMTWAVHMRRPGRLWRDLGPWRFFGVQVLFLGTISQFLLAPLLWSFWLLIFGLPHPVSALLPPSAVVALTGLFLLAELITIAVGVLAVSGPAHRHLTGWVPTLHFYYPLAAIACYKGVIEMLTRPFYWDKTAHGVFDAEAATPSADPATPQPQPMRRRA